MLLSIKCQGERADALSPLLLKEPDHFQSIDLDFARAYIFFPENTSEESEACLLLDTEYLNKTAPNGKGRAGFDHICQSISPALMARAISHVYDTVLDGICMGRGDLVQKPLQLRVELSSFSSEYPSEIYKKIFEPLGYKVDCHKNLSGGFFSDQGFSGNSALKLEGRIALKSLLEHLYVLLPVFDGQGYFWQEEGIVEKFVRYSETWLPGHPEANFIIDNFFGSASQLKSRAREILKIPENDLTKQLKDLKIQAVLEEIKDCRASSLADLGCGQGDLLVAATRLKSIRKLAGMDVSARALKEAKSRLEKLAPERSRLFSGSLLYEDDRLSDYEIVTLCEVLEYIEFNQIQTVMENIFDNINPAFLIITASNRACYEKYFPPGFRHPEHRFEFSREEFQSWADKIAREFGYSVKYGNIGSCDEISEAPILMGVFRKCE